MLAGNLLHFTQVCPSVSILLKSKKWGGLVWKWLPIWVPWTVYRRNLKKKTKNRLTVLVQSCRQQLQKRRNMKLAQNREQSKLFSYLFLQKKQMKIRIWIKTVKLHQVRSEMIPIQITVLRKIYCTEICRYGKASNGYCAEMDLLKERSLEFVWEYGLRGRYNFKQKMSICC